MAPAVLNRDNRCFITYVGVGVVGVGVGMGVGVQGKRLGTREELLRCGAYG